MSTISSKKNEISKQLTDLFDLSFMTDVFPSVPKTAKRYCIPFSKTVMLSITYSLASGYTILHLSPNEYNWEIRGVPLIGLNPIYLIAVSMYPWKDMNLVLLL